MDRGPGMDKYIPFAALTALLVILLGAVLQAAAQEDIKERMRGRLPEIVDLKAQGLIGETSDGFLAFVGEQRPREDLVQAENLDRRLVYAAIAKQQGVTPEFVGKRRAQQISEQEKPGFWLQDKSGNWYQKQ
jgi:hypothetical protein